MDNKIKLTLRDVEVIFVSLQDDGFGRSLTINCTDKEIKDSITKWVKDNNIGKGDNAGKPNFKDYEGKIQYSFKINDFTVFGGKDGLDKSALGFGSSISLTAKSFEYDNKFGKGTSGALSAVLVESRAKTGADDDLAELLGEEAPEDTTDYGRELSLNDIPY